MKACYWVMIQNGSEYNWQVVKIYTSKHAAVRKAQAIRDSGKLVSVRIMQPCGEELPLSS